MPRGRDECWREVTRSLDEDSGKRHPRVTCNHCRTAWTSNEKARVVEHLQRCRELPEPLWRCYQPHRLDPALDSAGADQLQLQHQHQHQHSHPRPQHHPHSHPHPHQHQHHHSQQRQPSRQLHVSRAASISTPDLMSAAEHSAATAACAYWIHAANLDPSVPEHPAFRAFLRTLRPAFHPPTRAQLSLALFDAPLMLLASLADPHARHRPPPLLSGEGDSEDDSRSLQAFLLRYSDSSPSLASALLAQLSLLRARQGPFARDVVWLAAAAQQPSAIQWWRNAWADEQPALADLCVLALAMVPATPPPSSDLSAVLERNWSPHSFARVLNGNRVAPDVVARLLAKFWSLRIQRGWVEDPVHTSVPAVGAAATSRAPESGPADSEFPPDLDELGMGIAMQP